MENLHELKLNINQIADITGLHRQTVSQRTAGLNPAIGSNSKLKLFSLRDLLMSGLTEKMSADVDRLSPADRRAWYQSENERLRFERETGELIPASEVALEMGAMAKAVVQTLETLPDILERDCGLQPKDLIRVQQVIDDIRDQMALHIQQADTEQES